MYNKLTNNADTPEKQQVSRRKDMMTMPIQKVNVDDHDLRCSIEDTEMQAQ